MRFEVPQFIEIEDKIFGPFTWKQFVYIAGGIGVATVAFFTMPIIVFALIGLPIGGLAFLLAFYPINNRPFSVFLESIVQFYNTKRLYHWRKKSQAVYRRPDETSSAPSSPVLATPIRGKGGIHSLSRKLELNAIQKEQ